MGLVKGNDVGERMHLCLLQFSEVGVEVGLKFMQEHCGFRVRSAHLLGGGNIGIVDDDCSKFAHLLNGNLNDGIRPGTLAKIDLAGDTNSRSTQAVAIEVLRVVTLEIYCSCLGSVVVV